MVKCKNLEISKIRTELRNKITLSNPQIKLFSDTDMFTLLLVANDNSTCYYFAVFLKKLFKLVKENYWIVSYHNYLKNNKLYQITSITYMYIPILNYTFIICNKRCVSEWVSYNIVQVCISMWWWISECINRFRTSYPPSSLSLVLFIFVADNWRKFSLLYYCCIGYHSDQSQ